MSKFPAEFASQPSKKTVIITGASSGLRHRRLVKLSDVCRDVTSGLGLATAKELVMSGEWPLSRGKKSCCLRLAANPPQQASHHGLP